MRGGALGIAPPVLLAPMAAVPDLPFRTVAEELGVGFTITEFLSAHALAVGDPKTTGKLTASLDGRRFGVQIFGREEAAMDAAAKMAVSIGASLVDINMGCPAKRVVAGEGGSAVMPDPALAHQPARDHRRPTGSGTARARGAARGVPPPRHADRDTQEGPADVARGSQGVRVVRARPLRLQRAPAARLGNDRPGRCADARRGLLHAV